MQMQSIFFQTEPNKTAFIVEGYSEIICSQTLVLQWVCTGFITGAFLIFSNVTFLYYYSLLI
jgi:hypothetical protein